MRQVLYGSVEARRTTLLSVLVALTVFSAADALARTQPIADTLQHWYTAILPLLAHRSCEGVVAVASFYVWGFMYSFFEYFHVARLQTLSTRHTQKVRALAAQQPSSYVVATNANGSYWVGSMPTTDAPVFTGAPGPFAWWLCLNTALYLGIIDVSQRILGDILVPYYFADASVPSVWRVVVEVCFSVFAYDALFWGIHASWHWKTTQRSEPDKRAGGGSSTARMWHWWQRYHLLHHDGYQHREAPLHPMSTFHHHILDAGLQVAINIFVQQIPLSFLFDGPRHKVSKIVHNVVVTYLLVEAHSGFDLPFMSHRVFPSIFGGSVRHQIHHQHGVCYHQFFTYLDDAVFGVTERRNV